MKIYPEQQADEVWLAPVVGLDVVGEAAVEELVIHDREANLMISGDQSETSIGPPITGHLARGADTEEQRHQRVAQLGRPPDEAGNGQSVIVIQYSVLHGTV